MLVKEYDYIKGNTAVNPRRQDNEQERIKREKLERAKRNRNKRLREEEIKTRKGILQVALIIVMLGFTTILRDSKVYEMQRDVTKINKEIKVINDENEAMRVDLLKVASLDNIKTNAEERLGMVAATKENMVEIDFSENYFEDLESDITNENNNQKGLFSRLMDALK